jgi:hypothetical protein
MNLSCLIQGHSPAAEEVWNRGYSFTRCARCDCDLIRSDADWETVPSGHRVVWKSGAHRHSRPAGYARNLPVLHRQAGVPALWQGGWFRHLLLLSGGGAAAAPAEALTEERAPGSYPYLIALAAIAGAGLQLLFAGRPRRGS